MGTREALLIGIGEYGEGFAPLPAVQADVAAVEKALQGAGYTTRRCPEALLADPTGLDTEIRVFSRDGGPDDVRLVYFSGHGMRVDEVDWIVPAGRSRAEAAASPNQRVSTDLSRSVAESKTGLVLFVIDACRDRDDAPAAKGGEAGWGDPRSLARRRELRFVRWYGCAPDKVCQVLPADGEAPAQSLFTRALVDTLAAGRGASLEEAQTQVKERCSELLRHHPLFVDQDPRLGYGEISADKQSVLRRPIFDPRGPASLASLWARFEPDRLHCLVVLSERSRLDGNAWGLADLVAEALAGRRGETIWQAFRTARANRLVDGRQRALAEAFEPGAVVSASIGVLEAFSGDVAFDGAVRALGEADLVVFDMTGFEPGVMLLAGIRSACRRGLNVCSHGGGWKEGESLPIPFNLQDLNLNSHTEERKAGGNPVVERFVQRVESGFRQLARQPSYQDLPGYDALRQLGPDYDASSTIGVDERLLVLCSYGDDYPWNLVSGRLSTALSDVGVATQRIERIIDYGTPQLVLQGLYEQIRRTAACVVDWTDYRESVFLELGARLAASEWGAVQIVSEESPMPDKFAALKQVALMRQRLQPIGYRRHDAAAFKAMAVALARRSPNVTDPAAPGFNRVYRVLLDTLGAVQEALPAVVADLQRRADALHHPRQGQVGAPQVLYAGSRPIKQDAERAALELRVAAWLYSQHRLRRETRADAPLAKQHRERGTFLVGALYELGDDDSIALADWIEERMSDKDD